MPKEEYGAKDLAVLEGLDAVRKRPGMYIGTTDSQGLMHCLWEIIDNSVDEALAGFCNDIVVTLHTDGSVEVADNGRGIPVDKEPKTGLSGVEVVLTKLHAGAKFGNSSYNAVGGLHGVGSSVVNALSTWLEVEISRDGKVYAQRFERGVAVSELTVIGASDHDGTLIRFQADPEIFTETTEYEFEVLQKRLREQAFLNAGLSIRLTDTRDPELVQSETYCYEGGISSFVDFMIKTRGYQVLHPDVIHMSVSDGDSIAEVALQYNDSYNENIVSFANNIHTVDGGVHETAFKTAITRIFNDYARKHGLLKDNDTSLKGDDVREGLTAVISVKLKDAQFEGQTKAKLGNTAIGTLVNTLLNDKLAPYLEENPAVAKAILEKSINAARVREAAQKARELARKKSGLSSTRMPEKLADCIWSDMERTELYIVEGDSALGTAKAARNAGFQALLPIRGKILNVQKASITQMLSNKECAAIIQVVGAGSGQSFDIEQSRYHKIIIMTDADVDGAHIRILLLTLFYRYMRPLIEHGYVYAAVPPLHRIALTGSHKGEYIYTYSDDELAGKLADLDKKRIGYNDDIQRYKGLGEMDADQLADTTMDPRTRMLRRIRMEDAAQASEIFSLLMGDDVPPRKQFIVDNADDFDRSKIDT